MVDEMKPFRIQLRRTKGWRMPENTVRVTRPGLFGNPWTVEECGAYEAVQFYRNWLTGKPWGDPDMERGRQRVLAALPGLRGKNLACWCKPRPHPDAPMFCHADVLLELANAPRPTPADGSSGR
jgi:hypothetical protein